MKIINKDYNLKGRLISNLNLYYDITVKNVGFLVEVGDVLFYNGNFYKVNTGFSYTGNINDNLGNISLISFSSNFEPSNSTEQVTGNITLQYGKNYIINNSGSNIDLLLPNSQEGSSLLITNIGNDFHITQNNLDTIESTTHITTVGTSGYINVSGNTSFQITCIGTNKFIITKVFGGNLTFN